MPLLFANPEDRISCIKAQITTFIKTNFIWQNPPKFDFFQYLCSSVVVRVEDFERKDDWLSQLPLKVAVCFLHYTDKTYIGTFFQLYILDQHIQDNRNSEIIY